MMNLETFEVCGEQKSIDFYRCYSSDYPYVDAELHDNSTKITLLFNGLSHRLSTSITFSLSPIDLIKERQEFRIRQ